MNDQDGQTIKKLTVRVPISTYLLLDDLARAARQPIAAVARDLLVDRAPKAALTLISELTADARGLSQLDGQTIKKLTVRVPISTYLLLDDIARAARQPIASVARDLLVGKAPKAAAPLIAEITPDARSLIRTCLACVSNLTQIDAHSTRLGMPLSRLSGPTGVLFKLGSRAYQIGLMVKAGQMDPITTSELLARLEGPARALNEDLARPLNEGYAPSMEAWRSTLEALQSALRETGDE